MKAEKSAKVRDLIKPRTFSAAEKNVIVEKLITARIGLLMRHPFFGNLATRLNMVDATDWCGTLATDGRNFYYNNDFVNKLTNKEAEFGFAHEVLHNVFDHMGRREDRHPVLSNIAADYAVNQILKDEKIGEVPSWIKIYQEDKYRGKSYEEIYDDIYEKADKIDFSKLGELLDEHLDGEDDDGDEANASGRPKMTGEEKKQIRDEIKEAVLAAAQAAGAGKVPLSIARMIKDFTEPKMDWRELLRMNIQSIVRSNFSFSRPNRKSQHSGAILPGMMFDNTVDVCAAIDMSGSISDSQANDFISEIKGIMEEYQDFKLDLFCFDTRVYNHVTFTGDNGNDISEYEVEGGGGTDFMCIWNHLKDQDIIPKKLIIFTDMYPCGSWGDPDYCDALFIGHGTDKIVAPFGETAYYSK